MKVLLVDDDSALAEVTAFALRRASFAVTLASDGEQALALWERDAPDLLILDIQLPGIDGLSVCRTVRQRSQVPIIMLTIRDSDEDIVHGLEIGADDYLTKPFSFTTSEGVSIASAEPAPSFTSPGLCNKPGTRHTVTSDGWSADA